MSRAPEPPPPPEDVRGISMKGSEVPLSALAWVMPVSAALVFMLFAFRG